MGKIIRSLVDIVTERGVRRMILFTIFFTDLLLIFAASAGGPILSSERWKPILPPLVISWHEHSLFSGVEFVALITPGLAILMAAFAHWRDDRKKGRGVKDIITRTVGKFPYSLDADVISASMTKQSVLAAIAAALVALIQLYNPNDSRKVMYQEVVKTISTIGFAFAILLLLVSMVCYDYAGRFRWPPFYKAQLVHKALVLDVWSWYLLLASFVLTLALVQPWLSILTSITAGFLMWWYYFFPRGGLADNLGIRGISNCVVNVKDLAKAEKFYCGTLGLDICARETDQLSLRVGAWSEIILRLDAESPSPSVLSCTMPEEDLQFALKTLEHRKINFTTEPPEANTKNEIKLQSIHVADADNQHNVTFVVPKKILPKS
jgi:catechol 2,3-dioxygenase-like lactoylglutathione lyase family enzyme